VSNFDPERDGWHLREAVMRTEFPDLLAHVRSCMEELRARGVLFDQPDWWSQNLARKIHEALAGADQAVGIV
jgi:hypothetical protein